MYFDTSAIVKLYCEEAHSDKVDRLVTEARRSIWINRFHELELENALRLKAYRGEMRKRTLDGICADIEEDVSDLQFHNR